MNVRMPDGTIIKNVPEGTTQTQLDALLNKDSAKQPIEQPAIQSPQTAPVGIDTFQPAAVTTGAIIGGAIGAPLGPAGMLAGSALGAAAGQAFIGGIKRQPPKETAMQALDEARTDLLFTGGVSAIRPLVQTIGAARRGLLGVGEQELKKVREAEKFGVGLGAADVTRFNAVKSAIKVIGRFPFLGTPAKQEAAKKAEQVFEGKERIMARLGPIQNLAEIGIDLNKAARNAFKGFRDEATTLYERARDIADSQGAIIPTQNIKKIAGVISENFDAARPGRTGKRSPIVEYADTLKEIPDSLTGSQYDALVDDLDVALTQSKQDGFAIKNGMTLKNASEIDLRSSTSPEFADAIKEADEFFSKGMNTFETPTAQKFNRVGKNVFKVGLTKQGTLNEDELFRAAFNTKSPEAMKDLRGLVGPEVFNKAVRNHIETAFTKAKTSIEGVETFDPDIFINKLGLSDPNSAEFKALQTALKPTNVDPNDLVRFARVASDAFSTEIPNVSTFIARRAALGGGKSALKALIPGLAVTGGAAAGGITPAMAILVTLGTRRGVKVLSSPRTLKLATQAMDKELTIAQRRVAAVKIVRTAIEQEQQ